MLVDDIVLSMCWQIVYAEPFNFLHNARQVVLKYNSNLLQKNLNNINIIRITIKNEPGIP